MKGVDGEAKQPGQLLKDLVEMYNEKGNAKFKIEWHFDKRSLEPNDWSDTYLATIKNELEKGDGGEKIRELLGMAGEKNDTKWEEALDFFEKKLDDGFVKIIN